LYSGPIERAIQWPAASEGSSKFEFEFQLQLQLELRLSGSNSGSSCRSPLATRNSEARAERAQLGTGKRNLL